MHPKSCAILCLITRVIVVTRFKLHGNGTGMLLKIRFLLQLYLLCDLLISDKTALLECMSDVCVYIYVGLRSRASP